MSVTASQLIATVSVIGAAESEARLLGVGAASEEAGGKLGMLAIGGIALAAAGLVVVGVKAAEMAGNFQMATSQLVTSAGEQRDALDMVRQGILTMAPEVGTSVMMLVKGMYMVESAGFHGAAGLEVLRIAAMGAKAENADLGVVTNAVTSAMNAYGLGAGSAAAVTNTLIAATAAGKMHMQDLASAVSNVLPATAKFHISLIDTTAAIATMTMQGDNAASAATHLRQVILALESPAKAGAAALKSIGLTTQQVSNEMKISLPGAIQMIIDHLGKKFPEGTAAYNNALKSIAGGNKQLLGFLELSGTSLKAFETNVKSITSAVNQGGSSIAGWDIIQGNFNFKMDQARAAVEALMIKIGTALLPVLSQLLDAVTPLVLAFTDWITSGHAVSDVMQFVHDNAQIVIPILAGLAAMLLAILIPAVWALAAGVIAATWPIIAIGVAVAGLVALLMYAYNHWTAFRNVVNAVAQAVIQLWNQLPKLWAQFTNSPFVHFLETAAVAVGKLWNDLPRLWAAFANSVIVKIVLDLFKQFGDFIVGQFVPLWHKLVDLWNADLLPALKQLWGALVPLMPLFKLIAEIIGGILVVALGLLIGLIIGLVKGLANLLSGIVTVITGIVQIFTGLITIVSGMIRVLMDIVTGNFTDLGAAVGQIWQGIVTTVSGLLNVMRGAFVSIFGTIWGIVSGFVQGVYAFFMTLYNNLVGHSLIPDMMNSIVQFFAGLPGRVLGAVQGLLGALGGFFGGLANTALSWGANIVNNIAAGIRSAVGAVTGAIGNVVSIIASHLPHSPAEVGPLRELPRMGAKISEQIGEGMASAIPSVQATMNLMLHPMTSAPSAHVYMPPGTQALSGAATQSNQGNGQQIVINPPSIYLDGRLLANGLMPHITNAIRYSTGVIV